MCENYNVHNQRRSLGNNNTGSRESIEIKVWIGSHLLNIPRIVFRVKFGKFDNLNIKAKFDTFSMYDYSSESGADP